MLSRSELKARGWTSVTGIASRAAFIELACSIGRPLHSPTGELVRELTPTRSANAPRGTLSDAYSTGPFPLHTDTAFWPVPSKYVVLRALGDIRRRTTVLTFADLFREGAPDLGALADRSIWLVRTPSGSFHCSMKFRSRNATGWRLDGQCMFPINDAAHKVQEMLRPLLSGNRMDYINWNGNMAVVLCNWEVLHGRGPSPPNECGRILERIYVG
jgi:hypothetical protein